MNPSAVIFALAGIATAVVFVGFCVDRSDHAGTVVARCVMLVASSAATVTALFIQAGEVP